MIVLMLRVRFWVKVRARTTWLGSMWLVIAFRTRFGSWAAKMKLPSRLVVILKRGIHLPPKRREAVTSWISSQGIWT